MGYTTDFHGEFTLDRPLTDAQADYLRKFADTRRMERDEVLTERRPDPLREAVGLPVGLEGGYFVNEDGPSGQGKDMFGDRPGDVLDYNIPPKGQPGLWCQWVPNWEGTAIEWDGGEKFYNYTEWLKYLIEHFLKPWGYVLNGSVEWNGEDRGDVGKLVVEDNVLKTLPGSIVYGDED